MPPPRRFLLVAPGTAADARPLLNLGAALQSSGHAVSMLADPAQHAAALSLDLAFLPLPAPELNSPKITPYVSLHDCPPQPAALAAFFAHFSRSISGLLDAVIAHLPQHDVLVVPHLLSFLKSASHAASRPCASLLLRPDYLPASTSSSTTGELPGWLPRLLRLAYRSSNGRAVALQLDQVIQRHTDVPLRGHGLGKFTGLVQRPTDLTLVLASPKLFPPSGQVPPPYVYSGYLPASVAGKPTADLAPIVELAHSGAPVIVVCLEDADRGTVESSINRLARAWRTHFPLVVQSDYGDIAAPDGRPEILCLGPVPLDELFSYASLVVHQGGSQTSLAALYAGRNQIILASPQSVHYWPEPLARLGVARLLATENWPEQLTDTVSPLLHDVTTVRRVTDCATVVREENGCARAVAGLARLSLR